ncbi:MAG: hypothetical protein P8Y17_02730 [Patescibacteria group bacterium]
MIIFWPLLLFLASKLFVGDIVLGTYRLSVTEAAIFSGALITFLSWVAWSFLKARGIAMKKKIMLISFLWLCNAAAVWIVARFAYLTGLGISSYRWALLLGLVTAFAQEAVGNDIKKRFKFRKK